MPVMESGMFTNFKRLENINTSQIRTKKSCYLVAVLCRAAGGAGRPATEDGGEEVMPKGELLLGGLGGGGSGSGRDGPLRCSYLM